MPGSQVRSATSPSNGALSTQSLTWSDEFSICAWSAATCADLLAASAFLRSTSFCDTYLPSSRLDTRAASAADAVRIASRARACAAIAWFDADELRQSSV